MRRLFAKNPHNPNSPVTKVSEPLGEIGDPIRIEICERREALSASLVGESFATIADELLGLSPAFEPACPADWTEPVPISTQSSPSGEPDSVGSGLSLLQQAAAVGNNLGLNGSGQTVAVIDSGIAYSHIGLGGGFGPGYRVVGGWDFAENDDDPFDDAPGGFHGSHIAGLISGASTMPGGETFRGIAPGADLVALRVFDDFGGGNLDWIESALRWVHDHQDSFENPITTVNLSIGTELNDDNRASAIAMLEDELAMLREDDILVFAATGNGFANLSASRADEVLYPASSQWVVGVGATDANGDLANFSQRTDSIFAAPGVAIRSTVPEHVFGFDGDPNDYALLSGTSLASPQAAAASVLVREAMINAGLTPTADDVLDRLRDTSTERIDPITGSKVYNIDLAAAVDFDVPTVPPNLPALLTSYSGTPQSDSLTLDLNVVNDGSTSRGWVRLTDSANEYRLQISEGSTSGANAGSAMVINAAEGADTLVIRGTTALEQLTLRGPASGQSSSLLFAGGSIELRGFEHVTFIGGGGSDRATMFDSPGNDTYRSEQSVARLTGPGYGFEIRSVPNLYVHATAGGNDTAHLSDSMGDDSLVVRQQFSSIRGVDPATQATIFQAAFGFEQVYAYSTAGGTDRADLGDSAGDDLMTISRERAMISSLNYRATAMGFANVSATASLGGVDTVRMFVDDPNGQWITNDSLTQWQGSGLTRLARGFERSETFEQFRV